MLNNINNNIHINSIKRNKICVWQMISLPIGATFASNMHLSSRKEYVLVTNLSNPFCQCQTAYSALDSCLDLFGGLNDWWLKPSGTGLGVSEAQNRSWKQLQKKSFGIGKEDSAIFHGRDSHFQFCGSSNKCSFPTNISKLKWRGENCKLVSLFLPIQAVIQAAFFRLILTRFTVACSCFVTREGLYIHVHICDTNWLLYFDISSFRHAHKEWQSGTVPGSFNTQSYSGP